MLILFAVWNSTASHAQRQLSNDLNTARTVLGLVLDESTNSLFGAAKVVTKDFGLKRAVATDDVPTIKSMLSNHGKRVEADVMAVVTIEGKTVANVPDVFAENQAFPYPDLIAETLAKGTTSKIISRNNKLYQLLFLTIDAPSPIAVAVIGFEINMKVVNRLQQISQLGTNITITDIDETGLAYNSYVVSSSASEEDVAPIQLDVSGNLPWFSLLFSNEKQSIASSFMLVERDDLNVEISLSTDIQRVFSSFLSLLLSITVIAVLALGLATLLAAWLSKQMARPVESLTRYAKQIADGNYEDSVDIKANTQEFGYLSNAFKSMQENIRERESKIIYQAQHDELTGLFNRNYVDLLLQEKFEKQECFQAIGINIFGFRDINDTFGYHNGDLCLQELANRVIAQGGLSARLTGGELLWVPQTAFTQSELELVRDSLQQEVYTDGITIPLRLSIGVIECPSDTHNTEDLFRRMNIVIDEAQLTRQSILRFDAEFENRYLRRLSIITELKLALSTNQHELALFYQPKMQLAQGKILSVEALIRWQNDKLGFISPEDFIAIAEHAGFINKITEWVYQQAVQDIVTFREQGVNVSVAINISAQDVMNPELMTLINSLLTAYSLPTEVLSFELTEGDLIKDPEKALQHLGYMRAAGFSVAIDDFGTGYSSLAYLTQLPINVLKIDKSFVLNLDTSVGDQTIVKTVISLAHSFGMEVVAEGVENVESLKLLTLWGCEWAQGYYICRPIAAKDLITWYKAREQ